MSHERRIFALSLAAGLPGSLLAMILLWTGTYSLRAQWTLTLLVLGLWIGFCLAVRQRTILPLRTLANLLESLREGDYSVRARTPEEQDALGELMVEVNSLGELLQSQRFHAVDATQLLEKVIEEIDLAVFTFDAEQRLRLVNRAGERLMAQGSERLLDREAEELGLEECLEGEPVQTFERTFPGLAGRWQSRRGSFREEGKPQQLLVLTDLSKALRQEERQAWQRLIRVLGHELNNSLAPIKSTASTLALLLERNAPPADWRQDAEQGLGIIADRCESLNRFVASYSRLARLPAPRLEPTALAPLLRRVVGLENRLPISLCEGPETTIPADADQLEQLLINLSKNAVEAALETGGGVTMSWSSSENQVELRIVDDGLGLANTANLFVPFFTTKSEGTGIGLVLCRQIAEAHGGSLSLANRSDARGCEAKLRLPR